MCIRDSAEDLGYVTDSVRHMVWESGFPGMKVFEFAFDTRDTGCASDYLPHNYPVNSVVYTGTHDNAKMCIRDSSHISAHIDSIAAVLQHITGFKACCSAVVLSLIHIFHNSNGSVFCAFRKN